MPEPDRFAGGTPDLTAAVEKAARDYYEATRADVNRANRRVAGAQMPAWDGVGRISQHHYRQAVLPIINSVAQMIFGQGYQARVNEEFGALPRLTDEDFAELLGERGTE